MKLWLVTCRGMHTSATGMIHGIAYVVAENPDAAYQKLREALDEKDVGFRWERELLRVELIADGAEYPKCDYRLIL